MGAYDRTEVWELVGNFLLHELSEIWQNGHIFI